MNTTRTATVLQATALALGIILLNSACGGTNNPGPGPGPNFLAPVRYFPSQPGATYTYEQSGDEMFPGDPNFRFTYTVEANPLGTGVYYNLSLSFLDTPGSSSTQNRGPLFNGLDFTGMAEEKAEDAETTALFALEGTDTAQVLPPALTAIGQQWPIAVHLSGGSPLNNIVLTGTATLANIEDITVNGHAFSDCLRVDVDFGLTSRTDDFALISGSYWLAPDFGPVQGVMRIAGLEAARVELTDSSLL